LSLRDFPSLRIEVKDNKANVWVEENSVDTAGSIILSIAIVIALSHLTSERDKQQQSGFNTFNVTNSGLLSSLRLTAGLLLAAIVTIFTRGEGVLIAQKELRSEGNTVAAVAVFVVVSVGGLALYKSTQNWSFKAMFFRQEKEQPNGTIDEYWPRIAFLTCEILLLSTLAYSIPKSYGGDIAVASLFLIGLASTALVGDACFKIHSAPNLSLFKIATFMAIVLALGTMIVTVMLFPMIVYSDGITVPLAWGVSVHIFLCVAVLPTLSYLQRN